MRSKIYTISIFLLIGTLMSSCASDDDLSYQNDFQNSQKAWLIFKDKSEDSYTYTIAGGSWVGYSWETKITVSNGKIIQRHFNYIMTEGLNDLSQEEMEWVETGEDIGSHENQGADALTLDDIYNKAENIWLIKRDHAKIYFETDTNGLIATCGYIENGCMDDCFVGIKIKSIESL
ncbi:hypothetical protein [Gelidibacter mesophilus]|uniref:hypothetical protein n=1 Tax=Gelidibacter mesophilus TaxID=169050 RepID=UPI00040B62FC|nr:hypothetical protein [Gelidibacter mesophilus]